MAIFLPFTASATFTSLGGIAHCVAVSNSVDSISLPSGSLSPTLIVIKLSWGRLKGEARMIPKALRGKYSCLRIGQPGKRSATRRSKIGCWEGLYEYE